MIIDFIMHAKKLQANICSDYFSPAQKYMLRWWLKRDSTMLEEAAIAVNGKKDDGRNFSHFLSMWFSLFCRFVQSRQVKTGDALAYIFHKNKHRS